MDFSDIAAVAETIRGNRFDGMTDNSLADEIDKFRRGPGIKSIGSAVDALKAVSGALADTDKTLRDELAKLGVEWQSQAGGQAGQVFAKEAGFSVDAKSKVDHASEQLFSQGEGFVRTLHKLPDSNVIRKGAGGFTLTDNLLSLIGFETDHVRDVSAALNARAQAVEAMNAYSVTSGDNLATTQVLSEPEGLRMGSGPTGPSPVDLGGAAVDVGPGPEVKESTKAAHISTTHKPPVVTAPSPGAPTPPIGVPAPDCDPVTPQPVARPTVHETKPASNATAPAASRPPVMPGTPGVPGVPGVPGMPIAGGGPRPVTGGSGPIDDVLGGSTTFDGLPTSGGQGSNSGVRGGLGGSAGLPGLTSGAEQHLGKGKLMGSGPQAPLPQSDGGKPFAPMPKPGMSAGDMGSGAAAVAAGGVGAAVSGEPEKRRTPRGQARTGNVPLAELPEEEQRKLRGADKLNTEQRKQKPGLLSEAAPQEQDAEHVRRYGVDDKDLFADERMVSPDTIGDA
ncbi:hypothetical protein SAMN05421504_102726 [Amycolatopsis xylanica]|uniref:PPE family protein n=1 Tax=Amycolatopsis xylanica TaxID=589385 RepID=A0A1H3A074_9PSEU|nr:hypothetical protein [Amycolatopsis xylanica]SDX22584.1 hypothetical protein SAMN05421504_102726 [Amycolatopsis xylanica]